jgi:phage shock protein C
MQPRLTRSTSEKMLAGVCGGLGEYFVIDPVIVRLVFVLTTMTSGIGIPVYLVLAIVMPRQRKLPGTAQQRHIEQDADDAGTLFQQTREQAGREVLVSPPLQQVQQPRVADPALVGQKPAASGFDPFAVPQEAPIAAQAPDAEEAMTGETVHLDEQHHAAPAQQQAHDTPRRKHNWRALGFILVGIGSVALLEQVGLASTLFVPLLLIIGGILLLGRGRRKHHS